MAKVIKLYWDSCAWLGLLNGEAAKKRELELVYGFARQGHYEIWTSTLAMVEVRRFNDEVNVQKPLSDEKLKIIRDIFRQPFVKTIPLSFEIAEQARELVRITQGLSKWPDAVHVASALRWNIETMHTYDAEDLLHLSDKLNCKNGQPLKICYPNETTDGPLFNNAAKPA